MSEERSPMNLVNSPLDSSLLNSSLDNILDPSFWIRHWEHLEHKMQQTVNRAFVRPDRWDKLSKEFSQGWRGLQQADPMRDEMLLLLKERGILREGIKILDLGCGTGRFAIPFAQAGALVTAVDVSEGMLHYLREETPPEVASRIIPLHLDWLSADIDQMGFRSAFDLAFAHMTPAVSGPESFLKFISTSRHWCAMAAWSGKRRQNTAEEVWRHLTGKELDQQGSSITLAFNLLYSLGYRPSIDFSYHRHESLADPQTEADILLDLVYGFVENGDKEVLRQRILSCLQGMAHEDGRIRKVMSGYVGRLIFRVDLSAGDCEK